MTMSSSSGGITAGYVGLMPTCREDGTTHKRGFPSVFPTVFLRRGQRGRSAVSEKRWGRLLAEGRRQLEPRPDPELGVGAAEVPFDGLLGHEQGLGKLPVGLSRDRFPAHPPLRGGQC